MTTWIGTNQCGWDTQSIGFHSLNGCTGMVVNTANWVAGWHIGGGAGGNFMQSGQSKLAVQQAAFLDYLQQINPHPWPANGLPAGKVRLWVIHLGQTDWKATLREFATALGYTGKAQGLNLQPSIGVNTPCDAVITRVGDTCQIDYKRTSKMVHTPQTDPQRNASVVKTVRGSPVDPPRTQALLNNESHTAGVLVTTENRGSMHRAGFMMLKSLNV